MKRSFLLAQLAEQIASLTRPHPVRVAIDGVDAAGKTMLADELVEPVQARGKTVIRASVDGFHNPRGVRYRRGSSSPTGYYYDSFDYQALKSLLLEPLGPGGNLRYRTAVFDHRSDSPVHAPVRLAHPDSVLLFDGVFLLRPELYDFWDLTIFVDVDTDVSVQRACARHRRESGLMEDTSARYHQRYVPGQRLYLKLCRPKERAVAIVNNNDWMNPSLHIQAQDH
jgi:uridine kinase